MTQDIRDTIARVAEEEGIDPAFALAVAERESSFNPSAHNSRTIHGLFQMRGDLRHRYGVGDSEDPEVQTRGWAAFQRDLRTELKAHTGRDPTDQEVYLAHFWGGPRAGRVLSGAHRDLAPSDVFTPYEMSINPELSRHPTMGSLADRITGDMTRRMKKHGSTTSETDFAQFGPPEAIDFAQFGEPPANQPGQPMSITAPSKVGKNIDTPRQRPGTEIDLSQWGQPLSLAPDAAAPLNLSPETMAGRMPPPLNLNPFAQQAQ